MGEWSNLSLKGNKRDIGGKWREGPEGDRSYGVELGRNNQKEGQPERKNKIRR